MTREAKIGMLTGLGVIVLIGALLSNYLGDAKAGTPAASSGNGPTGQMADLNIGETYRQQVLQPIGVPAMAAPGARTITLPGGTEIASPVNGSDRMMPPAAFAVESSQVPTAPVTPVTPIQAGPAIASVERPDDPPTISLAQSQMVPVKAVETTKTAAPQQMTYVVAQGDSLGKIAKKFYNSSKTSDVQRIVTANPGTLKDVSTMLVVGKKLIIPGVTPQVPAVAVEEKPVPVYAPGSFPKPGPVTDDARKVQPPAATPKTTTYTVQNGDTLEKISRKLAPTKVNDTMQKLISLNSIKDPASLRVGTKLKVPA